MSATHERLLTAAEVAQRLGFTERYVWRRGREGVLPRVKLPGRKYVRFCESDVERFVRDGRRSADRPKIVTLAEWAGPWLERIAAQVEADRMSPQTYNHYEGAWRLYLGPALGKLPLGAITHDVIVKFMRDHVALGLSESRVT